MGGDVGTTCSNRKSRVALVNSIDGAEDGGRNLRREGRSSSGKWAEAAMLT